MLRIKQKVDYLRKHIPECIFGLYCLIVFLASVASTTLGGNKFGVVLFYTLVFYSVCTLVPITKKYVVRLHFCPPENIPLKKYFKVFFLCSVTTLIILGIVWAGVFPGVFSPDPFAQIRQVVEGHYNDWHPVLHTLLFFTLPMKVTGSLNAIVPFQIICFSLFVGCLGVFSYRFAGKNFTLFSVGVILLSPFTLSILMNPWKDVGFAIAAAMSMLWTIDIYFDNKVGILKIVFLSLFLVAATFLRHNGILFTLPLLLGIFFVVNKRSFLMLCCCSVFLYAAVNVSYRYIGVEKPGGRVIETMGFALSVITNVAKECPQCLNAETKEFVDRLFAPQPNWRNNHDVSGFNSVKFLGIDGNVVENAGRVKIFKMMGSCIWSAPVASLKTISVMTAVVWGIEKYCDFSIDAEYNSGNNGVVPIRKIVKCYTTLVSYTPLKFIFCSIGFSIIIILAFVLFKSDFTQKSAWRKILLCVPILVYDFGTMLFLSGDNIRFFYVNQLVFPMIILLMARQKLPKSNNQFFPKNLNQ